MRFGIFYEHQLPRPWADGDEQRLIQDALTQVELADRLGFQYVWEVEHHFLENEKDTVRAIFTVAGFSFGGSGQHMGIGFVNLKHWDERKAPGKATDAKTTHLLTGCSHKDALDRGSRLVATFGLEDGISPFTTFQVTDASGHPIPGCDVSLIAIHGATTELRCTRPLTVLPADVSILATIPAPPELDLHGDGSIGDDHDDRLEA